MGTGVTERDHFRGGYDGPGKALGRAEAVLQFSGLDMRRATFSLPMTLF